MKLNVPYFRQFNKHSCFVASTAMVLCFYGTRINQRKVYNAAKVHDPTRKRRIWGCYDAWLMPSIRHTGYRMRIWQNRTGVMPPEIKKWHNEIYLPEFNKAKRAGLITEKKNATIGLIKQLLLKGIPVIAEVHTNTWYKLKTFPDHETHMVVIIGYEGGNLIVNDPFLHYLGKNGRNVKINIAYFRKAWEAPPLYKNVMVVFEK